MERSGAGFCRIEKGRGASGAQWWRCGGAPFFFFFFPTHPAQASAGAKGTAGKSDTDTCIYDSA